MARFFVLAAMSLCLSLPAQADDETFQRFVDWLSGRWDNRQQSQDDQASGMPSFDRHPHYAMNYVAIDAPAIDGQLFAIQSYNENGFDGPLTRVALHRFVPSRVTTEIVHEFFFLNDASAWGDLRGDLSSLQPLRESDVRFNRDCRMYWRWVGDHFEGRTRKGRCVTSSYTEKEILIEGFGALYEDRLLRHDMNYELSGELRPRQGGKTPEIFFKRR